MSTNFDGLPEPEATCPPTDSPFHVESPISSPEILAPEVQTITLASLHIGARLVVRCKADWRAAAISVVTPEHVKLLIHSPRGGTYRIRRPSDTPLHMDGSIPVLTDCDETTWRDGLASYDKRW